MVHYKNKMNLPKNIKRTWLSLIFLLVLLAGIFLLPNFLSNLFNILRRGSTSAAGANSRICFDSACNTTLTVPPSNVFTVPVFIDTDNANIRGVDVVAHFDTNYLTLIDINPVASISTTLKVFAPVSSPCTDTNPQCTFNKSQVITNANSSGNLEFGAVTFYFGPTPAVTNAFTGTANLALLTFQPKQLGTTNLIYTFTSGSTTDTNLVSDSATPTDILASAVNLALTVANPTPTPPNPSVTSTSCPNASLGNINCDSGGHVNLADYSILFTNFGISGPTPLPGTCPLASQGDINCDGKINLSDYSILFTNFGI